MREKLIEILLGWGGLSNCAEDMADYLIENGVRLESKQATSDKTSEENKRWIPVTERLPDANIPSKNYLCFWKGNIRVCKYWRTRKEFVLTGRVMKVTHWMPLPDAPKEGK